MFFSFKQKTAYEMRMSDGSSAVCSSDLAAIEEADHRAERIMIIAVHREIAGVAVPAFPHRRRALRHHIAPARITGLKQQARHLVRLAGVGEDVEQKIGEHTSELQSLMRISYAVFCLKNKKKQKHDTTHIRTKSTTT